MARNSLLCADVPLRNYSLHSTPPQGNQELLVVKDKVGRPQVSLRVSKCMECDIFPSVL